MKIKNNYHTHIYLCRHATGDIEDYVARAIELGYTELGISDHCPFPDSLVKAIYSRRMTIDEYHQIYLPDLERNIKKYQNQIKIYKALEIEYLDEMKDMYPKLLKELDYLILGQHYFKFRDRFISVYSQLSSEMIITYANSLCEAMETGYFKIVAHPDIFCWGYPFWDDICVEVAKKIIDTAVKNHIVLEINVNGIRNCEHTYRYTTFPTDNPKKVEHHYAYPNYEFFKLVAESQALVIINDDAHNPNHLYDEYTQQAIKFAENLNIKLVDSINFSK